MSQKIAKKIRKATKYNYIVYVKAVEKWPYIARWRFAWHLIDPIKEIKKWHLLERLKRK